ncbi:MAG TPA: type II toxin-antitoxin system HigB family toxin [Methylocystis sp.]|nr:type II toxin-antitoxin system HigB family toxin [Methylocystis sp.]
MRIIKRGVLAAFWTAHPETEASLEHWLRVAEHANWRSGSEVTATFPKAKALNAERVRFEVAGGNYRLVVAFRYDLRIGWIKFLGTHAEYDRVDALTVSQF